MRSKYRELFMLQKECHVVYDISMTKESRHKMPCCLILAHNISSGSICKWQLFGLCESFIAKEHETVRKKHAPIARHLNT